MKKRQTAIVAAQGMPEDDLGAISERAAAKVLNVHPSTLGRAREAGDLSYRRVNRSIRYTRNDILEYLENVKTTGRVASVANPKQLRRRPKARKRTPVRKNRGPKH